MRIKLVYKTDHFISLLIGFFILFPFGIDLKTTELFIFQIIEILILFLYSLVFKLKIKFSGFLDQLFLTIILWTLVAYLISFYNIFFSGSLILEIIRFKSLIVTLTLYVSYLVGKTIFSRNPALIKPFFSGVFYCFMFFNIYFLIRMFNMHTPDLMKTRVILGQRIPMVICYLSIFALVLGVKFRSDKLKYFTFFILGAILVVLSVTRAAYLQLISSLLLVLLYSLRHKPLKTLILATAVILIIGFGFAKTKYSNQVYSRIESFASSPGKKVDVSISYRLEQWNALLGEITQNPIKLIFGHGQLGASYIKTNVNHIESSSAHSQYFDILIREGAVGLLLFMILFSYIIYLGIFRSNLFPGEYKIYVFANSVALFGVFFYSFFHESLRYFQFGYYFMFISGFISFLRQKKETL